MADLIVQHRFCSDAAFGFAARPRRACGLLMRGRLAKPRRGALSLCRFVALSTPRGITLRFAFGSARSQPSFRIESRASHRLPPAMFHLLHFLTASEAGGFAALVRVRARPDAQRFLFPAARAAKRDSAARTQPSARRRRPRARAAPAKGRGEPPRSIATPARADCANVPPSRWPHRWRHVRVRAAASHARRQAPNAVRHPKHRARAHAPAGAPFGRFSAFAAHRQAGRRH